ncbi:MAG: signal peptidase I [Spirochaetes bacterium]|nr:signal peptidase I [Spirochaetota bacterium]
MDSKQRTLGKIIQDIMSSVLLALCIAVILRVFFIEAFFIPSSSMEDSFKPGDQILTWKFLYNRHIPFVKIRFPIGDSIDRGDVIVFKLKDRDDWYIKRVIGLPGDIVHLKGDQLMINGKLLRELYVKNKDNIFYLNSIYEVPENKVFVLGDNRNNSGDSREFGYVPTESIIGKVFFIYYPFTRVKFF